MLAIYGRLLAFVTLGFALPEAQLRNRRYERLSEHGSLYGTSAGYKQADIKDYPFVASLVDVWDLLPAGAGMIINKHWILTTAFVTGFDPEAMQVFVGTNSAGRTGQRTAVSKILTHEKYSPFHPLAYNIALLKTETALTFGDTVKPVKLGSSVPKAGTDCSLLGYGYIEEKPFVGNELGVATVQVKSQDLCEHQHEKLSTAFCAEADGVVPCYGDNGDPLIYKKKLVGFYIQGDFCNQLNKSEVYTNVPSFKKWIWKTIKENSDDDETEGRLEHGFHED